MPTRTLAKAFMPSRERDFEQSDVGEWGMPKKASEFVMLIQSLIDAEGEEGENFKQPLERYNEVIDNLHDPAVFALVVVSIKLMEHNLTYAEKKENESSRQRIRDFRREIAILQGFLADHSDEYDHLASIEKLLALEDDNECTLASITESLVVHFRSKEEVTEDDECLLNEVEDLVEDFLKGNSGLAIAYKMRSDVLLASAIYLQKLEDLDPEEIENVIEDAKRDALRAVSIDHNGKYDDQDIDLFKLSFPDIVGEILNEEHRWRRS